MNILIFSMNTLFIILIILSLYFLVSYVYNLFISLYGYKDLERDYELIPDESRFLLLVAAHNEENVIRETIRNLKEIDYDDDKYDICIVSDNSTDQTTQIAKDEGVMVVDTIQGKFPRQGIGKPAGLQYSLMELGMENVKRDYDLVMILDADNFVSSNILKEVNSQYIGKDKPEVIQSYLDSKNSNKIMSLAYSMVFWTNNRFMQLARYRLGLLNSIGGTGFSVRSDYLVDTGGFNYKSLTEDLEMEVEITMNGGRILWNDHSSIYDEKPEGLKVSMKQRHRWAKGHFYVAFKSFIPLLIKSITKLDIKYFDKIVFLMTMGRSVHLVLMTITLMLQGLILLIQSRFTDTVVGHSIWGYTTYINDHFIFIGLLNVILLGYSFGLLPLYATYRKIGSMNVLKNFIAFIYYAITDFVVQTLSLFTFPNQSTWYKTPHIQNEVIDANTEIIIDGKLSIEE